MKISRIKAYWLGEAFIGDFALNDTITILAIGYLGRRPREVSMKTVRRIGNFVYN